MKVRPKSMTHTAEHWQDGLVHFGTVSSALITKIVTFHPLTSQAAGTGACLHPPVQAALSRHLPAASHPATGAEEESNISFQRHR